MFTLNTPIYYGPDDGLGGGGEPAPDAGGAPLEGGPAPDGGAPDAGAITPAEAKTFSEEYVRELRDEAAGYRTKAKPFSDAFQGYEEAEVEVLLDLVREIQSDPKTAAARMEELVQAIRDGEDPEPDKPLTKAEVENLFTEREQAKTEREAVAAIKSEAETLGYKEGTRDYVNLLWTAQNETNFDLKAAHEALQKDKQSVIDAYVKQKADEADGTLTPSSQGSAASTAKVPKTWAEARASVEAKLNAVPGQ